MLCLDREDGKEEAGLSPEYPDPRIGGCSSRQGNPGTALQDWSPQAGARAPPGCTLPRLGKGSRPGGIFAQRAAATLVTQCTLLRSA